MSLTADDLTQIQAMIAAAPTVGEGFPQPIVAGQSLLIPSIQSPNFSIAGQTGWSIMKNGLAYFFAVVLSGGTITGPDYIINTSGIFIYSGTPAAGNLIGSWAGAAGTDAFGNAYPQGLNITVGDIAGSTITGSVFDGTDFIMNSAGAFFYSAAPAAGNLIASIASIAGTDGFGNAYNAGIWSYSSGGIQTGLTQLSGAAALALNTGDTSQVAAGEVYGQTLLGSGSGRVLVTNIQAPQFASDSGQATLVIVRSESFDGTIPQLIGFNAGTGQVQLIGSATPQFNIGCPGINVPANMVSTSNQTISTTIYSNVTGLTATLVAGATYLVEAEIYWKPTGTIGGNHTHGFNYSGTAAADSFSGTAYQATSTATINQGTGQTQTVLNASNVDVVASPTHLGFQGWTRIAGFITTSTAGTLNAVMKIGTSGDTVQTYAGSFMKVTRIS